MNAIIQMQFENPQFPTYILWHRYSQKIFVFHKMFDELTTFFTETNHSTYVHRKEIFSLSHKNFKYPKIFISIDWIRNCRRTANRRLRSRGANLVAFQFSIIFQKNTRTIGQHIQSTTDGLLTFNGTIRNARHRRRQRRRRLWKRENMAFGRGRAGWRRHDDTFAAANGGRFSHTHCCTLVCIRVVRTAHGSDTTGHWRTDSTEHAYCERANRGESTWESQRQQNNIYVPMPSTPA